MSPTQSTVQLLPLAKELDENKVTPGVLGFLVFAVIGVAVWMLMKSMNRHMNRVDFDETAEAGAAPSTATTSASPSRRTPAQRTGKEEPSGGDS